MGITDKIKNETEHLLGKGKEALGRGTHSGGQVGDGSASQADKYSPVAVAGRRAFTTITAGYYHTCGLDTAGKAWCWGSDASGQVGDGSASQANTNYSPVAVAGGQVFQAITAGHNHTCGLDAAGKAWCWGNDNQGQVGDGAASQARKYSPVRVVGDRVYTTISAGSGNGSGKGHTCALDTAGRAWCWGYDGYGQVGDGSASQANKYSPVKVAGGRASTTITAGGSHTCALDTGRKAWCWGYDAVGQIGDGSASQANKYSPVAVAGNRLWLLPA